MSFQSKLLFVIATCLYINSAYSSYQLTQLSKLLPQTTQTSQFHESQNITTQSTSHQTSHEVAFPLDLTLEVLVASLLFLGGALLEAVHASQSVVKSEKLKKISKLIKLDILKPIEYSKATSELEVDGFGIYDAVHNNLDFIDIRARRANFQKWVDDGMPVDEGK
ncbi:unnamed protein product [Ambrosiozyma monospora]|uniref:Unnamed protein product n=1 Tax=Ambrosiozyma monospora TaxID=43982 RepID=A0ACB5TIN5_AMBMO|nr:unnamed protein product [Ambrosiozyma monospora]